MLGVLLFAPRARAADLTTYGYGNARLSASPGPGIPLGSVHRLGIAWVKRFGGAIDDQPLVVNGVRIHHRMRNLVLVGTGHGKVVAMDVERGKVIWERQLGSRGISPSCQASPDGRFGITGTMVVDKAAGRVYAVDVNGHAWALDLGTGRVLHGWPVRVHPPGSDFVWGALALSRGQLYVPVASLCDKGLYFGGIKAVDVANPRHIRSWETTGGTHEFGGGIWGWGGLSVDDEDGDVFAASGNALPISRENAGDAEQIIRLSPTLRVVQHHYPLQPPFAIDDRDFGTTPVLISARGCNEKAVALNKDGVLYVYNAHTISDGPTQSIRVALSTSKTIPLYGMPAYDPASRRLVLVSPSAVPGNGLRAGIQSFVLTPHCRFVASWQRGFDPPNAGGPPTIAGGVLYIGSGRNGVARAFRLSDGHQLWARGFGSTIFAAPSVEDKTLFVADWLGRLWALRAR